MAERKVVVGASIPLRMIALLAIAHLSFAGARLTLALKAIHLDASPLAVGALMSLLMAVPMFIAVPVGRWADRIGFFRPALLGFSMLAAAGVLAALWPSMPMLGVASVLVGSGYMTAHVSVTNAIGQASTAETRARSFGAMAMAFSVSGLVGPMLAGFAIDYASHAVAFTLLAAFPLVSVLLLILPHRISGNAERYQAAAQRSGVMDLLRHAPLRAVFIVSGLVSMGWDLFAFILPLHGVRIGLTASEIGLVVGAFGAGSFAIRLGIPWLVNAFDEWRLLCASLGLTAACYLVFPFCESFFSLLPLAFLLGMVLGCGQPLGMSLVHLTAPPSRSGEAVGVRSTITSVSQTMLPLVFGALGSALGMVPVFWAAATVLASGSAYARNKRPR